MRTEGVECDRCGKRDLCPPEYSLPDGWGAVRLQRLRPFCDSGNLELCPDCWDQTYARVRRGPKLDESKIFAGPSVIDPRNAGGGR